MFKLISAIIVGKLIFFISRTFKIGGGSAAPGYYALKIDPDLVSKLSPKIEKQVVVTGTNGKSTTSKIITHFLKSVNITVIHNSTGSNLERGIASSLISDINLVNLKFSGDYAVWELDEAAFNNVVTKIKPQQIVILNALRDQLDRYGEVDSVVKKWQSSISKLNPQTILILNSDDFNVSSLSTFFTGKSIFFGVPEYKIKGEALKSLDLKIKPDLYAEDIKPEGLSAIHFQITLNDLRLQLKLPVAGNYQIYNLLAAFQVGLLLNISPEVMTNSLKDFKPIFGRMEKISLAKNDGYIFLIKNPTGANQVFKTLNPNIKKGDRLLLMLNDNFADGLDVSWIWDANFELLQGDYKNTEYICSGTRAEELGLRLKYAGILENQISIEKQLPRALKMAQNGLSGRLFILPTYTALIELQRLLTKLGIKRHYWEDQA